MEQFPISYTDTRNNTTRYQFNASGNLLAITYPNGTLQQFSYDPVGDPTELLNARGDAVGYKYNTAGQLTETDFADGTKQTYTYDSHGNLKTAADATGSITLEYTDPSNPDLVTKITYPDGTFLKFQYNVVGKRTQSVDQSGFTINYTYDALGRLEELSDATGKLIVQYTYDPAGQLIQKDMGNGTQTTFLYDSAGNVMHLVNLAPDHTTVNSRFDYQYDSLGRATRMNTLDGTWNYTYDPDSQLIHAVFTSSNPVAVPNQDLQYIYDAAGNRVQTVINGVTTNYNANNVNEYTAVGDTSYQYDADGNLTSKTDSSGTTTYNWNDENRLIGANGPGLRAAYTYDPLGNRNSETVNGQTTRDLIDPWALADVAAQYDGSGNLIAHYVNGLGLVNQVGSGGTAYYDFDKNGNTVGLTGAAGRYVNRYNSLPFGETTTMSAAINNPFTFVGQFGVSHDGSGFFNMGFRNYEASMGRFLSRDPIGLGAGDSNFYRYGANIPTVVVDPNGLKILPPKFVDNLPADINGRTFEDAEGIHIEINEKSPFFATAKDAIIAHEMVHARYLLNDDDPQTLARIAHRLSKERASRSI